MVFYSNVSREGWSHEARRSCNKTESRAVYPPNEVKTARTVTAPNESTIPVTIPYGPCLFDFRDFKFLLFDMFLQIVCTMNLVVVG